MAYNSFNTQGMSGAQIRDTVRNDPVMNELYGWLFDGGGNGALIAVRAINAAYRAESLGDRQACNASGGFYTIRGQQCFSGSDAYDYIQAINPNSPAFERSQNWLEENSDNINDAGWITEDTNDNGDGDDTADCVVITQENADECGYEITSDGQLVPIDLGDDPNSYPTYVNCGGGIFAETEEDCPEMEGTGDPPEDQTFEDYVKEVGEGVANTAQGLYDELKDKITDCVGSPLDCVKKIGEAILESGGIPDECKDLESCSTADGTPTGGYCWKDCVNFNLPGLPIPNIPLPPGVVDVGTYRDFENAVKTVGKTVGDLIEGDTTVEEVLKDLGTWAKEEWENVFGDVDDVTVDGVLDWLKGILGPVTAGMIWTEIEEEVKNVLSLPTPLNQETKECPDPANPGQTITTPIDEECPTVTEEPPVDCNETELGCCPDGETAKTDAGGTECPDYVPPALQEQQDCEDKGRKHDDVEGCTEDCLVEGHVVGVDGICGPPDIDDTDDDTDDVGDPCTTEPPAGSFQYFNCVREGWGYCSDGTEKQGQWVLDPANNCGETTTVTTVDDTDDDTDDDPFAILCSKPRPTEYGFDQINWDKFCGDVTTVTTVEDDECANGATNYPDCTECPNGPNVSGPDVQCIDGTTVEDDECFNGATNYPDCTECPEGQTKNAEGQCEDDPIDITEDTPSGGSPCAQQNRVENEDGSCGECKAGYEFDSTLDECVEKETPVITTTSGGEDPASEGGGGGGGGGGTGMFSPAAFDFSWNRTPELVVSTTPYVDYTTQLKEQLNEQIGRLMSKRNKDIV